MCFSDFNLLHLLQSLRMVGISKGSSKALCFVIDTTKSMRDDINTVKAVTSTIINSNVETEEPSAYILVPFSDPGRLFSMVCENVLSCLIDLWGMKK